VAEAANIPLFISGKIAESSVSTAAAVHLGVALRELTYDISTTSHYLEEDIAEEPLIPTDGWISPPSGSGLGVVLDEDKIKFFLRD
jgi:L-alanine-DL-glutamate epimerase-like enolase superfamily enzyme